MTFTKSYLVLPFENHVYKNEKPTNPKQPSEKDSNKNLGPSVFPVFFVVSPVSLSGLRCASSFKASAKFKRLSGSTAKSRATKDFSSSEKCDGKGS